MSKTSENKGLKIFDELEEGDRILFNDRKTPLTVKKVGEEELKVEGPQGGKYILYTEEDAKYPLIAKPGSKKYSSYVKKLRKVGEWQKEDEKTWKHTKTDAEISLEQNSVGFWTLNVQNFDEQLDLPKYGFSDFENALEEAEKLIDHNPEG